MRWYILRHGHSPSAAEAGVARDYDRPLSEAGREDVRRVATLLAERGARPALVLHSPLKRAAQTAAEAAAILRPAQGLEAFPPLANELGPEELTEALRRRGRDVPELLIVGHQPQVGELVLVLSHAVSSLRPGGVAALEPKDDGSAAFLWACNPEDIPA
jgi:phosphohistidine phosphatase